MTGETELIRQDIQEFLERHERKSLLRFITCGSVDDGKSTLIGRLLWDSRLVCEDQIATLEADSKKVGTRGGDMDYALLLDGLQAEREQGITIDVAYRFFATERRKFIVADTPGHVQYTRNMVTGASTADVAVILIDARKGVLPQTRRHSYLVSLVGIRHVILAINKMDLVGYDRKRFETIVREYHCFADPLGFTSITAIPISAVNGDNVTMTTPETPWYHGPSLLECLETIQPEEQNSGALFRMPVQWVNRPNPDFRGYCGTVASGTIRPQDPVMVSSSRMVSRVDRIVSMDGDLPEATAGEAVTITLADDIDISRGDILSVPDAPPLLTRHPEAHLVWMSEEPLQCGQIYLLKSAALTVPGRVARIEYRVDVDTLAHHQSPSLGLNDIGVVTLELDTPVLFDRYADNRWTGSFILIDRYTNATVGAGMVIAAPPHSCRNEILSPPPEPAVGLNGGPSVVLLDGSESLDLTLLGHPLHFEVTPRFIHHLGSGNRVLLRLSDGGQLMSVLTLAQTHTLSFECDPTADGITVMLFRRILPTVRRQGDGGGGI